MLDVYCAGVSGDVQYPITNLLVSSLFRYEDVRQPIARHQGWSADSTVMMTFPRA